jgi:hypothetical protein
MATDPRSEDEVEQHAKEAARRGVEQAAEAARKGTEQAARAARTVADANSEVAQASAQIMERNAATLQHTLKSGTEICARMTERAVDQLSRAMTMSGDGAERTSGSVSAMMQTSALFAEATQGAWLEWVNFTRNRMEHNLERFEQLLRCRTPQDIVVLQSDLVKDNVNEMLGCMRRIAEKSIQTADQANRKYQESTEFARRTA